MSEEGRKAALLAGLDGRARQTLTVDVPAARLHLVRVDAQGVPRLKLRPQYERRSDDQIIRVEMAPTYDAPPTLDELYALAARNYELERLYEAQRVGARTHRADAERELRARVAQAFLADPIQRALPHPAPTPARCFMQTDRGRRIFDVSTDEGLARELPPEAHRRFRADLKLKRERNQENFKAQRALHEQKLRAVGDWIANHGSPDQKARQIAGVLPIAEAIEAMTDLAFAAANGCEPYARDGVVRLQAHLRGHPGYEEAVVTPADLVATNTQPTTATKAQWELLQHLREALPAANVYLRAHRLTWRREVRAPSLTVHSAVAGQDTAGSPAADARTRCCPTALLGSEAAYPGCPCRHTSPTAVPPSTSRKAYAICSSVNFERFIGPSLRRTTDCLYFRVSSLFGETSPRCVLICERQARPARSCSRNLPETIREISKTSQRSA